MLQLKHIKKSYISDSFSQNALDDVSLSFRQNEFVAILGPSGSGKTTLLNIVGGLDQYTDGDLIINGKSTKQFTDSDWDSYRNHSIGFVFQSYNLIPHQSVLANVELALTLSGVSRKERRRRAKEALIQVGLGDQISKKPNQMSGGQMQRVAIARALVNNPDILLADEPTGALDSATSVQIMDLLKEVSKDRLVIMVTHNPELADQYANRIIRLKDGKITDDTHPFDSREEPALPEKAKKTSMSFLTALSLSLNNLMTKKARTFLTSFAGSIGIIGIALILALSSGIKAYINEVQEETLSSYPIQIEAEQMDMGSLITSMMGTQDKSSHGTDAVYASSVMYDLANSMNNAQTKQNNLKKLKDFIEKENSPIKDYATTIQYSYDIPLNIYAKTAEDTYQKADIMEVFSSMTEGSSANMESLSMGFASYNTWAEILPGAEGEPVSEVIRSQYELIEGKWPEDKTDIILVLDKNNEITDITLHALGLKTTDEIVSDMLAARRGETIDQSVKSYSYEEILNLSFKLIAATDYYTDSDGDGIWEDLSENESAMEVIINNGLDLNICGIIRPLPDAVTSMGASLYYTSALTDYLIERTAASEVAKAQLAPENQNRDIFTGLPFVLENEQELTPEQQAEDLKNYFSQLSAVEKGEMYQKILAIPDAEILEDTVAKYMEQYPDRAALEEMIFTQYSEAAGIDEDSIRKFIADYSDEELRQMVETAIREMITAQYEKNAEEAISQIAAQPSAEELAALKAQITAQLTDRNAKTMYVVSQYTSFTAMPAESIMTYLFSLSDAELDAIVDDLATEAAKQLYTQYGSTDTGTAIQKVADAFDAYIPTLTTEQLSALYDDCMPPKTSDATRNDNLKLLGFADKESPSSINIYAATFADKDEIGAIIADYNTQAAEEDQITYTDYVALIMSSVTTIIDAISYVLIAFVSISLVVSSIMIGIITYISVLERTKEIGILRSIGASKRDISRVFNAETLIVGFASGAIGILFTVILCLPVNLIIRQLSGIESLTAYLPLAGGIILMLLSMFFTLIAGLFPAMIAAKKDPVVALRTE